MLTKLLRAISGNPEKTDWESMLTHLGGDSTSFGDSDAQAGFQQRLVAAPDPNTPDLNLALLGLSGEEIHQRAKKIAKELHALAERGATVQQWNMLIRDVTTLSDLGMTINSLAEIKLRKVTPKIQDIPMLPLVGGILAKRANDLRRSGVLLVPQLQSCTIQGDPNICKALIETALEWAMPFGNRLTVTTEISSWADAAKLQIMADDVVRTSDAQALPMERTSLFLWEMIGELAQAAGVLFNRSQDDEKTLIMLEFPIQVDELASSFASSQMQLHSTDAPQLEKLDVLVFVQSKGSQQSIDQVLSKAQCHMRFASGLSHLVRECELSMPSVLIIDEDLRDENAQSLIDDLRRHMRRFILIVIVKAPNVYDVGLPGTKSFSRLSAASIESNLRDALMFELAQN